MGKVLSVVQRQVNRINVENRAHRVISKDKPTPAPLHPYAKEQLEKVLKEQPEIVEQQRTKDPELQDRLKKVYVTSEDSKADDEILNQRKEVQLSLPQDRHTPEDSEFGYYEPAMIPFGRVTLRQAVKFILDHQADPKGWTAETVAKQYNLSPDVAGNILKYFRAFEVYIPETKDHSRITEPVKDKIAVGAGKQT